MAFDGITLHSIINELQCLENAKVDRVLQPSSNNIIISLYNGTHLALNIDTTATNYRIHLTTYSKSNPLVAPNFCMLLRKYLIGSRIKKIYMLGLERICFIDFECLNEMNDKITRTLAIELMGKYSNVILLNENQIIIDALKKFDSNGVSRDIMPTRKYMVPNSQKMNFIELSLNEFVNIINSSEFKTLETAISSLFTGISKIFIQSALEELHLSNTISNNSLDELYNYICKIVNLDSIKNNTNNDNIIIAEEYKNNYSIYLLQDNIEQNELKDYEINFFIDDFYYKKDQDESYIAYRNTVLKVLSVTLDKLTKKMENITSKIAACDNMEKYKTYGELLIANIYRLENQINPSTTKVSIENYYDNNKIIEVPIDGSLSISQNAEKYFKKYNKMKNTISICKIQESQTSKDLKYLESLVNKIETCTCVSDVDSIYNEIAENILFTDINFKNKKKAQSKKIDSSLNNYIKISIDDFDVIIGKNNKQNDYITLKLANEYDYWFHTKDIHGCHLILRCNGETPKISTITKCAEICAYYSKARFSSHVPVDYCPIKYVKKPHGAALGYVIYTNNKTIFVNPKPIEQN